MKWLKFSLITLFYILAGTVGACAAICEECHARTVDVQKEVVANTKKYIGIYEKNNDNRGPEIDKIEKWFGLQGEPYCLMFSLWNYHEVFDANGIKNPLPKIARVSKFYKWAQQNPLTVKVIPSKSLIWGAKTLHGGEIAVFVHGSGINLNSNWSGHAAISKVFEKPDDVYTAEGNTKPGDAGDQTGVSKSMNGGHDGIYERHRKIGLGGKFPIVAFVGLSKNEYEVK